VKWFRREKGFVPVEIMEGVAMEDLVRKADGVRLDRQQ
jgi:hypothetical protein